MANHIGNVDDNFLLKSEGGGDLTSTSTQRTLTWHGKPGFRLTFFFLDMPFVTGGNSKEILDPGGAITRTIAEPPELGYHFYIVVAQRLNNGEPYGEIHGIRSPSPVTVTVESYDPAPPLAADLLIQQVDYRPKVIVQ